MLEIAPVGVSKHMHRLRSLRPRRFGNRRLWFLIGVPVAGLAAMTTLVSISLMPPSIHHKSIAYALADSQLYVSANTSPWNPKVAPAITYLFGPRAQALAEEMTSPQVKAAIARDTGIAADQLVMDAPIDPNQQRTQQEPTGEKRSSQLVSEGAPYRIQLSINPDLAAIGISGQAPTMPGAFKLVDAAEMALKSYLTQTENAAGTAPKWRVAIGRLAPTIESGGSAGHTVTALVFMIVFALWTGMVALVDKLRRELKTITSAQSRGLAQIRMPPVRSSVSRHV